MFCPLAFHRKISPTYVQLNFATPLSVVFTDRGELVIAVCVTNGEEKTVS